MQSGIGEIFNTYHTCLASIHKNRFYRRKKDNSIGITHLFIQLPANIRQQVYFTQWLIIQ